MSVSSRQFLFFFFAWENLQKKKKKKKKAEKVGRPEPPQPPRVRRPCLYTASVHKIGCLKKFNLAHVDVQRHTKCGPEVAEHEYASPEL